ncbi:MAG: mevalonate kinase [bacterium]
MSIGFGYGKVILLGEHFVVHGLPALVSALPLQTTAQIKKIGCARSILVDKRPKVPSFVDTKKEAYTRLLQEILGFMNIKEQVEIELGGDLVVTSGGVGASAATSVSIARALNSTFELQWSDEKINHAAWFGEKEIHGNPSGIDNTAATFGGLFLFRRMHELGKFLSTPIPLLSPVEIVIADSAHVSDTKKSIEYMAHFTKESGSKAKQFFQEYLHIVESAQKACSENDLKMLGDLMNKNHEILGSCGISCRELDVMVDRARQAGALGAKLSGTGQGGIIVALTPGKQLQEQVSSALRKNGYMTIKTCISSG